MIYHTLYTVALLLLAVLLILAFKKISRLKDENFELHFDNTDLKAYNKNLQHISRSNLDNFLLVKSQLKKLKKHQ